MIDIGSPDPERMSPINVVKYLNDVFGNDSRIKMTVIDDVDTIKKEYPLAHAVTRASLAGMMTKNVVGFVFDIVCCSSSSSSSYCASRVQVN